MRRAVDAGARAAALDGDGATKCVVLEDTPAEIAPLLGDRALAQGDEGVGGARVERVSTQRIAHAGQRGVGERFGAQ